MIRVGALCPVTELGGVIVSISSVAEAAEHLGFDHLMTYEHVLGVDHADRNPPLPGPYDLTDPFHDPFVLFAYLAGRIKRLEFVTGVLAAPQRPTVLLAKQASDLALMSGGRFRLGLGTGWNRIEYEALGQDFRTRGARLDQQIELLRRLWAEPVVSYRGDFDRVDRAAVVPRPESPIPIWMGGFSQRAFERACRVGDGFILSDVAGTADEDWSRLQTILARSDRTDAFGLERTIHARTPGAAAREIERWERAGGTHATVVTTRLGFGGVGAHIEFLAAVAATLGLG